MGYSQSGVTESGAAATVEGATPPNDGTTWAKAGVDQNTGQTIWTQTLGAPNPALQAFILQNTNGADVPLLQQYTASPAGAQSQYGPQGTPMGSSAGSICPSGNCNANGLLPSQGTVNIGLVGSATIPYTGFSFTVGAGVIADAQGNAGIYWSAGPGKGVGADVSVGVTVGSYPGATTIQDYAGWLNNASVGAGLGEHASIDIFQDPTKSITNPLAYGSSTTYGLGIGGGASVSRTYTGIPIHTP